MSARIIKNHRVYEFANGERLVIYGCSFSKKADHTQIKLWTTNIEKDVEKLTMKGVVFDELDMGDKNINHIVTVTGIGKLAWFKDSEGNTSELFQSE